MRIAIIGYGKMGKVIEKIALQRNHEIVLKIDENNLSDFNDENLKNVDVAIEFSTPSSAYDNFLKCFSSNVPVVSGTTGWLDKLDDLKKNIKENNLSFFYASNFSLGVNLFFKINQYLAQLFKGFNNDYQVDIKEVHHTQKLDKPSGTAISLANDIINIREDKNNWTLEKLNKENEIYINAVREANIFGIHEINYKSIFDEIQIKHSACSRDGFALGSILSAEFLKNKKGFFTMNDLLKV